MFHYETVTVASDPFFLIFFDRKANTNMQNLLDNDKYFVQNDKYLVIEPGLTDKYFEQVISHNELLETMSSTNSKTPFDCFRVLPFSEIA